MPSADPDLPGPDREPSAAMGDLLLKGWTMLGEACPACGGTTPLMRKRGGGAWANNEGETYCVKCRAWVRYQEEGEEEASEESEGEEEAAAAAAPPARRPAAPTSTSAAAAAPAAAAASSAAAVSEAEDSALVDARQALVEALRDATLALRQQRRGGRGGGEESSGGGGGDNETNSCRASAARLVGECARALAAVRAALGA